MVWAKLDDSIYDHPKLLRVPPATGWVFIAGISWSGRHLTDGAIPEGALVVLRGTPDQAAELVAAGLWEAVAEGWRIHDYAEYQPSSGSVNGHRSGLSAKRSEAGRKGARARWGHDTPDGNLP
jgi:hypothetical protein